MTLTLHINTVVFWAVVYIACLIGVVLAGCPLVNRYSHDPSVTGWQMLLVLLSFLMGASFTQLIS